MNREEFFRRVMTHIKGYYRSFFQCFGSESNEAFEAFKIVAIYLLIVAVFLVSPILVPLLSAIEAYRECREEKRNATTVPQKR